MNLASHRLFKFLQMMVSFSSIQYTLCIYCPLVVVRAYDDSLRASQKSEQELKEKLDTAEQDSQEKDHKCSKQEIELFEMQKKMATVTDEYKQQQELLEKLQEKGNNYYRHYTVYCEIKWRNVDSFFL